MPGDRSVFVDTNVLLYSVDASSPEKQSAARAWLLSEDFQTGRRFDSITVVNPFSRAPAELGLGRQR